jgi:hypothetical protein
MGSQAQWIEESALSWARTPTCQCVSAEVLTKKEFQHYNRAHDELHAPCVGFQVKAEGLSLLYAPRDW